MCWDEYKQSRECSSSNGHYWIEQVDIPGWFVLGELGFGYGSAPSIIWTMAHLHTRPHRTARLTPHQRTRTLRKLSKQTGIAA
jgi:hypothetical protein